MGIHDVFMIFQYGVIVVLFVILSAMHICSGTKNAKTHGTILVGF
jgi:hypothetical protein